MRKTLGITLIVALSVMMIFTTTVFACGGMGMGGNWMGRGMMGGGMGMGGNWMGRGMMGPGYNMNQGYGQYGGNNKGQAPGWDLTPQRQLLVPVQPQQTSPGGSGTR